MLSILIGWLVLGAAAGPRRARSAVPEVHDMNGGLMPPVKHHHHQNVPHLVAGAQVVQLTWEERPRQGGEVENGSQA